MINTIVDLLKANKEVSAYRVISSEVNSVELFYVLDKLETNRVTDTVSYAVTIYHDFDGFRGSSDFAVSKGFSKDDINECINKALQRCKYVKNPYFEIAKVSDEDPISIPSPIGDKPFKDVACKCADAIFEANVYKEGWINSCEIFVTKTKTHVVNSNGVDLSSSQANIFIELIPTWKGEKEEVELYENINIGDIDYEKITKRVDETMINAKARAEAIKLPENLTKCNVIFQTEETSMIFDFFKNQLEYSNVFMHMNLFNVGDNVNDTTDADPIDITLKPYVKGATRASSFDLDGVVLKPCNIISNSKCEKTHGSCRFGYYLKEENPTGSYSNMEVKGGSMSYEDMKKEPHILCVYFSSPQVDGFSGYYGGEVRLGFYFDGEKYQPVTGFSVSGNLHEDKNHFRFSKELDSHRGYYGPKYLYVRNMTIS